MLNNIFDFLDKIGFASQKRALHIYFTNPEINNQVFLQRIDGFHSINEGLSAELICLSINPYISLKTIYWMPSCRRTSNRFRQII